jgi:Lon protease-like protein
VATHLPLFPLHTVLCPGIALPLHVFEPRYRLMVARCLAEDRPFGVVWIRDGHEVGGGELAIATIGTFAEIREADRLADGRYDLVALGTERFRVVAVDTASEPYIVARVAPVDDVVVDEDRAARLARVVTRRFVRYVAEVTDAASTDASDDAEDDGAEDRDAEAPAAAFGDDELDPRGIVDRALAIPADPTLLSHLLSGIVELDLPRRQALLEAETTEARLAALADVLAREISYLHQRLRVFTPDPREAAVRRN